MTTQTIFTKEEVEWDSRLKEQERIILESREDELNARENQIRAVWTVVTEGLYKPFHQRQEQPDIEHDQNLVEWLGTLNADGSPVVAYSTWRKMYETIVVALTEGMTRERAFRLAAKASDSVPKLRAAGAINVNAQDGSQFLTTGKPVTVSEGENFSKLGVETTGEYLEKLADMPTGRHVSDAIRTDMGTPIISVRSLWETSSSNMDGVDMRVFQGEVMWEDAQGGTPYQFSLYAEKEMPVQVLRQFIRKVSQKFAHLANGKGN